MRGRILGALGRSLTLRGDSLENRADLAWLAKEQPALRRVATLVARGSPADELFAAVTQEVGRLLPVDFARMRRYDDDGTVTFLAGWSGTGDPFPADPRFVLGGENLSTLAGRTAVRPGSTVMPISGPLAVAASDTGVRSGVGAPIIAEDRLWGVMVTGSRGAESGRHAPAFDRVRAPACRSRVHLRATRFIGSLLTAVFARTSCSEARSRCA